VHLRERRHDPRRLRGGALCTGCQTRSEALIRILGYIKLPDRKLVTRTPEVHEADGSTVLRLTARIARRGVPPHRLGFDCQQPA
jgi:hypothetical protein